MRRLVIALVLVFAALPAFAQTKPYATPHAPLPGGANSEQPWQPPPKPSEAQQWQEMKQQEKPGRSGFWTSPYPAKHGAYRWRLLLLGCATVLIMGLVILRVIKRTQPPRRPAP
jgi:hypothetical protein